MKQKRSSKIATGLGKSRPGSDVVVFIDDHVARVEEAMMCVDCRVIPTRSYGKIDVEDGRRKNEVDIEGEGGKEG